MTSKRVNDTVLPINREQSAINISAISLADSDMNQIKNDTTDMGRQLTSENALANLKGANK